MQVIVDQIENDMLVLELDVGKTISVPRILIPDAKEGDVVDITINKEETKKENDKVQKLVDELFK